MLKYVHFSRVFFCLLGLFLHSSAISQEITPDLSIRWNGEEIKLFGIKFPSPYDPDFAEAKAALEGLLAGGNVECFPINGDDAKICKVGNTDIAEELLILGLAKPIAMGEPGSDADFLSQHYLAIAKVPPSPTSPHDWMRYTLILVTGLFFLGFVLAIGFCLRLYRRRRQAKLRLAMLLIQLASFKNMVQEQLLSLEGLQAEDPIPLSRIDVSAGVPPILLHITKAGKFTWVMAKLAKRERDVRKNWQRLARLLLNAEPPTAATFQKELAHLAESAQGLTEYIEQQLRKVG